jgi:hypothetical protein
MRAPGAPPAIARRYNELNFGRTVHSHAPETELERDERQREVAIVDAWFENTAGERIPAIACGEPCRACVEAHFNTALENPIFGFTIRNDVGATIFATTTALDHGPTGSFPAGQTVVVRLDFANWMCPSRYNLTPSIAREGIGADAIDIREDITSLVVHSGHFTGGVVNLPHTFELLRG